MRAPDAQRRGLGHDHKTIAAVAAAATGGPLGPKRVVRAAAYPQRPVKIVVAGLPGVPFDLLARAVADKLSGAWPELHRREPAGAAGNLGAESVARSVPDGYTALVR